MSLPDARSLNVRGFVQSTNRRLGFAYAYASRDEEQFSSSVVAVEKDRRESKRDHRHRYRHRVVKMGMKIDIKRHLDSCPVTWAGAGAGPRVDECALTAVKGGSERQSLSLSIQ